MFKKFFSNMNTAQRVFFFILIGFLLADLLGNLQGSRQFFGNFFMWLGMPWFNAQSIGLIVYVCCIIGFFLFKPKKTPQGDSMKRTLLNTIYLFEFDMLTSMLSRRSVPTSFKVSNDMVKVGITSNFEERFNQYKNTYHCEECSKYHVNLIKKWPVDLEREDCAEIEKILKREFGESRVAGEYYEQTIARKLEKRIDELTKENFLEEAIKKALPDIVSQKIGEPRERNQPSETPPEPAREPRERNQIMSFNLDDKFVRTAKEINTNRCAQHNIKRWEWIGKEGKTYAEIDARNSEYRQNIIRGSYGGNTTSIDQDLNYDIRRGWIKKV